MHHIWPLNQRRWKIIAPIFVTILGFAIAGIIGNRADAIFIELFLQLSTPLGEPLWVLGFIFLIVVIPLVIFLIRYRNAHQLASKLNELDDSLLLLLSQLDVNPDREGALNLIVDKFLEDTLALFADGCRISILHPDPKKPDYLMIWQSLKLPVETVKRTRFYIGQDNEKWQGVAAKTFIEGKYRIVHLFKKNGGYHADDPDYKFFVPKRPKPSYLSFITVPIKDHNEKCIAVLCVDSDTLTAFDSLKVQQLLLAVGRRLAAIMQIAKKTV